MYATYSSVGRSILQFMIYAFLAICGTVMLVVSPASAHTLKTDGTISASLHFEPDDGLMSGKAVTYNLFLNDAAKHFSFNDCTCTVIIKKDGSMISTRPMRLNSQNIISDSITFPKDGAYTVEFHGSPTKADTFQAFTLEYPEHIAPSPNANHPTAAFITGMCMLAAGLVVVAFLIKTRYDNLGIDGDKDNLSTVKNPQGSSGKES